MKLYKHIFVTLITALLTVMLIYGGYTIYAEGTGNGSDFRVAEDFFPAYNAYHGEMNDFFNDRIKKLNILIEDKEFYQNPEKKKLFLPPMELTDNDTTEQILEKCGEENVSTYCVSMWAMSKYMEYLARLDEIQKTLPSRDVKSGSQLIELFNNRKAEINLESVDAREVMEATVAAYNEFRIAYPMHRKYEEVITQLVKYRLALKDIRKRVARFPEKFVDATSSQCE